MLQDFILQYKAVLYPLAEISAGLLELFGIIIILFGSIYAFIRLIARLWHKKNFGIAVDLARALALALEFKMGAEIIKTVIIHNLEELAIVGAVIAIRALLAVFIHWEISAETKNKEDTEPKA